MLSQHSPLGLGAQVPAGQTAKQSTRRQSSSSLRPQVPPLQLEHSPALHWSSLSHGSPQHPPGVHLPRSSQHSPLGLGEQVPGRQAPKHRTAEQSSSTCSLPPQTPPTHLEQGPALQSLLLLHLSPQQPPGVHLLRSSQQAPSGRAEQVPALQAPLHLTAAQSNLGPFGPQVPLLHSEHGPTLQSLFLLHLFPQQPPGEHFPRSSQQIPFGLGEQVPGRQAARHLTPAQSPSFTGIS